MPLPAQLPRLACAVRFDRYGNRDVLQVREVPMPQPDSDEVLLEVRAAGINPGEVIIRSDGQPVGLILLELTACAIWPAHVV